MSISITKKPRGALRRRYRMRRRALSDAQQQHAAQQAARHARILLRRYRRCRRIALYSARDGELDLQPLLHWAMARGFRCYLPRIRRRTLRMERYQWAQPAEAAQHGRLHTAQTARRIPRIWSVRSLDLVVLPLVAFDRGGNRLGTGGGFYDRWLAACRRGGRRPLLLGAAHSCQERRALPVRPWDMPLDGVLTERGVKHFRRGAWRRRRSGGGSGNSSGGNRKQASAPLPGNTKQGRGACRRRIR